LGCANLLAGTFGSQSAFLVSAEMEP